MARRSRATVVRLLPLAVAGLLLGAAPASAQTAHEPTALQRFLGTLGLLEIPDDPIDYRERAPLVVPPSTQLVPPRNPDDIAKINPEWPLDHDHKSRRKVDAEAEAKVDEQFYTGRPLRPHEMRAARTQKRSQPAYSGPFAAQDQDAGREVLSPSQLGFKGWFAKGREQEMVFTGEPARRRLTDPPPGYMTPSPNAPYGVVSKKSEPQRASTLFDRTKTAEDKPTPR